MPTAWPTELPIADALAVLKAAARGQIDDVKPLAANVGWVSVGFLAGTAFPLTEQAPPLAITVDDDLTIDEAVDILAISQANTPGGTVAVLDPITAFRLARLLVKVTKRLLGV